MDVKKMSEVIGDPVNFLESSLVQTTALAIEECRQCTFIKISKKLPWQHTTQMDLSTQCTLPTDVH